MAVAPEGAGGGDSRLQRVNFEILEKFDWSAITPPENVSDRSDRHVDLLNETPKEAGSGEYGANVVASAHYCLELSTGLVPLLDVGKLTGHETDYEVAKKEESKAVARELIAAGRTYNPLRRDRSNTENERKMQMLRSNLFRFTADFDASNTGCLAALDRMGRRYAARPSLRPELVKDTRMLLLMLIAKQTDKIGDYESLCHPIFFEEALPDELDDSL